MSSEDVVHDAVERLEWDERKQGKTPRIRDEVAPGHTPRAR